MSPELSSFLVFFFADSVGNHQLKSKLNTGGESNPRPTCIPRSKWFSPKAKKNTVRRGSFNLFKVARVVNLKMVFTDYFLYNLIVLIK